ncbi:DUF2000 domain-containing protein [Cryptosporangium arvum]|uniref:DUF2000 domain-containing protein n=1 Tax=Cryptosporangium arvum DSM 44712 TaxID=927661 RepID=A0A010Z2Q1_9ACTN|nr:DUF2000 domain-containing protein [Cryptosporangium arvum]EXG81698.1 hypothetical protein CryarDRAFT_2817 [Cryptosporangium arvum DSM 44712]
MTITDEASTGELLALTTRQQRTKWVVVVDRDLPIGLIANAAACLSATIGQQRPDLLGPATADGSGLEHQPLPFIGCSILGADAATVHRVRTRAASRPALLVVDMPQVAQQATAYAEYQATMAATPHEELAYYAVGLVGPRNQIDKVVGGLQLLR